MSSNFPRIVLAAPKSGSGKTMITCALLKALKNNNCKVSAFKCGPDYIDPLFHENVLGIPSQNLDLYMASEHTVKEIFTGETDADISVIEGVMGLYDGVGGVTEEASTYHVAKTLEAPILLVVDAHGMGRSILALLKGFLDMDRDNLIKGVILNRVSEAFYHTIAPLIETELKIEVVGYVPTMKEYQIGSRHLGLFLPEEIEDLGKKVEVAAKGLTETLQLERICEIAKMAPNISSLEKKEASLGNKKEEVRIAVARDPAFCFYYKINLKMLEEAGARLVPFSPIADSALPDEIDGILLGGGYPELHAKELSKNVSMRTQIYERIKGGLPSLAECGGFMYLHEAILQKENENAVKYPMVGVVEGACQNVGKAVRFGYAEFLAKADGKLLRGHEFHHYDSTDNGQAYVATKPINGKKWQCMHSGDNYLWGFPHLYYPSNPAIVDWFIDACRFYKNERTRRKE